MAYFLHKMHRMVLTVVTRINFDLILQVVDDMIRLNWQLVTIKLMFANREFQRCDLLEPSVRGPSSRAE